MFKPMDFSVIDAHVHLKSFKGLREVMRIAGRTGIDRINLACIPGTPDGWLNANSTALLAKAMNQETCYVFGGLTYITSEKTTREGLRRQAEDLMEMGCDGVKMLEGKPTSRKSIPYSMNDPVYDLFYEFLEDNKVPIVWHVADPETFWDTGEVPEFARERGWDYTDGTFPSKEQLYAEVDDVLERFPGLPVIFAHFYFLSNYSHRAEKFLTRWPSVSFDITPGSEMYRNFSKDPVHWNAFFTKFQDRIVFGTDNMLPCAPGDIVKMEQKVTMMRRFLETDDQFEGFRSAGTRHVKGLGLERNVLEKIYRLNFERYAGTEPAPVNLKAAMRHCRRMLSFARNASGGEAFAEELADIGKRFEEML